jgi:aryl sulfotransferase
MAEPIDWPVKTREINDAYFESDRWNDFAFRDGDVVVATYPKMGTNWTQQIVDQLIHGARAQFGMPDVSPWLDMRIVPRAAVMALLEAQAHRRSIKTHLPLDALVFSPKARYLVVGRDARDMVWSAYNHQDAYDDEALAAFNGPPGRPGALVSRPDRDIRSYYLHFVVRGELPGFGFEPFWPHVGGWWRARTLPNVLMVHSANLHADLPAEIRRIARFLEIEVDAASMPAIVEHCGIGFMREAARARMGNIADRVFHKGVNGRWCEVLSADEIALCDVAAARNLPPDCAHWLATGELPD